jgi:hypothetical protein
MTDALLVGNNLAVLVAAAELGADGREVVLVTDGRPPGGHFRGLRLPEADFDIGMVLLEAAGDRSSDTDPTGYRPRVRYDWTRFGALVDRWQTGLVRPVRTPTPEVLVDGLRWPDHLITNRLDVLADGGFEAPPPLPRDDPRHASIKVTSPAYDQLLYCEAAQLNHGKDVQSRLIDPFGAKLLGSAYDGLLARYHRAAWLPLYWPESLTDAAAGRSSGLAEYPFWTTGSGFVGDVVRALEQRLAGMPNVQVCDATVATLTRSGDRWVLHTDARTWTHPSPVLGVGRDRLEALLGLPVSPRAPGASVVVMCTLVRGSAMTEPVGCLSVVDRDVAAYRVTDQDLLAGRDPEWHRVTVEAGPAVAERHRSGEDTSVELQAELTRLLGAGPGTDAVRVIKTIAAQGAVPAPTGASLAAETAACDVLADACPGALFTGALLASGATSMNDQVVQGFAVAAQLL